MLNEDRNTGNAMSDVRDLLKQQSERGRFGMKKPFMPTTVAETPASTISMDDDVDVAIVKLMMSYRAYTTDEVYQLLYDRVNDPEAIRPTMFMLNTNGYFDSVVMAGKSVYTLRRGKSYKELQATPNRPQVRRKKNEEQAIINPAGKIVFAEGLDLAIWKAMSDRKWRALKDIVGILREFGFDKQLVDRRLDTLMRSSHWFDRQGAGGSPYYRLKKNVPMPAAEKKQELAKASFTPDEALQACSAPDVTVAQSSSVESIMKAQQEAPQLKQETVQRILGDGQAVQEEKTVDKAGEIMPGDTLRQAIWKVMSDYEEYSVSDLEVLVADYGFTISCVSPEMSFFFEKGYVDRRANTSVGKRKPSFLYRLKRMPMPSWPRNARTRLAIAPVTKVASDAQLKDTVEQFNQTPKHAPTAPQAPQLPGIQTLAGFSADRSRDPLSGANITTTETKEEKTQMNAPLLQPVHNTVADAPLFKHSIEIKGVQINLEEFGQLYKELRAAGFQANRVKKVSLIQANSYNIKGVQFTSDELDALVGKMNEFGIALQKAITL